MELEDAVLERVGNWESLSRWEKSEFGKELRRLGLSYGEIMELVQVKKSTLATWCRDIKLSPRQIAAIKKRTAQVAGVPRDTQWKRRQEIEKVRGSARSQVPHLVGQPLWLAGITLYWAEGSKTRNQLRLANTDPRALRLFINWVLAYIDEKARFSIQLHLHEGNDEDEAKAYWRRQTGLDGANFYKTYIKPRGTGHRKNHIPFGVCTVKVRACSDGWHRAMEWIDALTDRLGV